MVLKLPSQTATGVAASATVGNASAATRAQAKCFIEAYFMVILIYVVDGTRQKDP